MVEFILILAFATAVFAIVITPGADMTIILTSALSGGRSAGLAAVGGVATGGLAHILFSVAGLTAIVAAIPAALTVLGWIGAAYLFWLGTAFLRAGGGDSLTGWSDALSPQEAWRRAAVTNLLNPKAYLFMLAVFPQFIRPDGWPVWLQASLLGALLLAIAIPIYSGLALAAAHMGRGLMARPGATVWLNRMAGVVLLLLGAALAAAQLSNPGTGA
mgnify:CR=1 FL=1